MPIVSVVIYSFNDSRLVTLWGGFSLRWYASLLQDDELLERGAALSLRIAVVSATFATALGALVALALHRVARLRGRLLLSGMVTAPLVMPEIITGLSLLFLFISMANLIGWPMIARRDHHHDRAHHLLDGLRRRRRALAPRRHGRVAGGGGDGPRRPAARGVLRHHRADAAAGAGVRAGCWRSRCRSTTS